MTSTPLSTLKHYWGHEQFRPLQEEIIQSVLSGHDTLALLPTGGGKSICFQVPGMMLPGLTLVVSPLIALMRDQVENLNRRGIAAAYINSSMSWKEIESKLQNAIFGKYKFLYCAPERLRTELFRMRIEKLNINLLAIDESHCISQWGHDFRPAYLAIGDLRKMLRGIPVIALTATATDRVKRDIVESLMLKEHREFVQSFRRANLVYTVENDENVIRRILEIAGRSGGSGIVYSRTRKRVVRLAEILLDHGIVASAYHGGMDPKQRDEVQEKWLKNEIRVITATNAFGMGIDKPDVRFVIHHNLPQDPESYYQEAGRAGRDGQKAICVSFHSAKDLEELDSWVERQYPDWETVVKHYDDICTYFRIPNRGEVYKLYNFDLVDLAIRTKNQPGLLYNSLRILHNESVIALNELPDHFGYIFFKIRPEEVIEYKRKYPGCAEITDFVLRTVGGEVYSDYVKFLPDSWAKKLGIPVLQLQKELGRLATCGIAAWTPPKDHPTLAFLSAKHTLTRSGMNWHKYNFLLKTAHSRKAEIFKYVQSEKGCRALMLRNYFGENATDRCGMCDLCKKELAMQKQEKTAEAIREEIRNALSPSPMPYRELLSRLTFGIPEQREMVLRELLDEEQVAIGDNSEVRLNASE